MKKYANRDEHHFELIFFDRSDANITGMSLFFGKGCEKVAEQRHRVKKKVKKEKLH